MKEKSFKELDQLVLSASQDGYPQALQIKVVSNGLVTVNKSYGPHYRYFDVASLTKIMVTIPLIMKLFENHEIKLDDPVSKYLPFLSSTPVARTKIQDLLSHRSGLVWWRPYYKELLRVPLTTREALLKSFMRHEKLGPRKKCIYSDLDFIVLGWLIEEVLDLPFEEAANLFIFNPFKLHQTFFLSSKSVKHKFISSSPIRDQSFTPTFPRDFAPTEKTKHRGLISGEVHDDNAWALGGVSSHAGLFSTVDDVTRFGTILLKHWLGESEVFFKTSTLKIFTKRAVSKFQGDWALGFMVPSWPVSSAGRDVSENAFGHTGFTGTSLWIDVKRRAVVTVLSNRTFPTRNDQRFISLRREIHDVIWKNLEKR